LPILRHYITIALRALHRQKGYAVLNVFGLGVGMAVCLLIGLYVHHETQVDRFHDNADRIAQFGFEAFWGRGLQTPYPFARVLENDVPGIERAVRTRSASNQRLIHEATGHEGEYLGTYTEPAFFEVFSFPALQGDPAAALTAPDGLILTETLARTIFGDDDALGQTLRLGSDDLTVHAVVRDVPAGSTIRFEIVVPITLLPESQRPEDGWRMFTDETYALLAPGTSVEEVEARIPDVLRPHFEGEPTPSFAIALPALYLSDLHKPSGFRGQTRYLYIFGFAALFVLLIAGINYVNLATAQGLRRAREIGVRKAVGANRSQVARQFLSESMLLSGLSLVVALVLVALVLPAFNTLFDKQFTLAGHAGALVALALFVLVIGVLAGGYPALVLSRFDPIRVLRQQGGTDAGTGWLRKSLVAVQFTASSVLLMGTAVIHSQVNYMQTKDLGFDGEQVVSFDLRTAEAWDMAETIRQEVLTHPGVLQAGVSSAIPTGFGMTMGYGAGHIAPASEVDPEKTISIRPARVDPYFVETMGLRLAAGRTFDPDQPSDAERAYVINEAFARALDWTPEEAVGQPFRMAFDDAEMGEIIGVVEDFHIASLHGEIAPVGFQMFPSPNWSSSVKVVVRLAPDDIPAAMRHLEARLTPFARDERTTYAFVDDLFGALYEAEIRLGRIFSAFAGLAILVACLGLFGLAAHAAHARAREIGVRKVLGASVTSIVGLLSRDLLALVAVAFVVAMPLAYWGITRWLEDFAYRIEIGPGVFALVAVVALFIALFAVSYHAIRAATADPVKALRAE
jgi:putative ABC transport system permease protein